MVLTGFLDRSISHHCNLSNSHPEGLSLALDNALEAILSTRVDIIIVKRVVLFIPSLRDLDRH